MDSQQGKNFGESSVNSAFLNLAKEHRFEIRQGEIILFNGNLCCKNNGGFNQLTTLPPEPMLTLLNDDLESENLILRVDGYGWFVCKNFGWKGCKCYFSKSQGILFVYFKCMNKGYALKLSEAEKLKCSKEAAKNIVRFKWKYGTLNISLSKTQALKWQPLLFDAFNGLIRLRRTNQLEMESIKSEVESLPNPASSTTKSLQAGTSSSAAIELSKGEPEVQNQRPKYTQTRLQRIFDHSFAKWPTVQQLMRAGFKPSTEPEVSEVMDDDSSTDPYEICSKNFQAPHTINANH